MADTCGSFWPNSYIGNRKSLQTIRIFWRERTNFSATTGGFWLTNSTGNSAHRSSENNQMEPNFWKYSCDQPVGNMVKARETQNVIQINRCRLCEKHVSHLSFVMVLLFTWIDQLNFAYSFHWNMRNFAELFVSLQSPPTSKGVLVCIFNYELTTLNSWIARIPVRVVCSLLFKLPLPLPLLFNSLLSYLAYIWSQCASFQQICLLSATI